jgi:hypothetical protein
MPRLCIASLESLTPYSQSGFYVSERDPKETWENFEKNHWREKMHLTADGNVFIPPMSFKFCITEAAKRMGRKIPGRGNATYGKRFEGGFLCMDAIVLPVKGEDVEGEWINANADGVRGSGKRVRRCFPVIPEWTADVRLWLTDDIITEDIFEEAVSEAGQFIGIGRFRPEKGGFYGRYKVNELVWESDAQAQAAE